MSCHASKKETLKNENISKILEGLIKNDWLTSVGGEISTSLKSIDIAFEIIKSLDKDLISNELCF